MYSKKAMKLMAAGAGLSLLLSGCATGSRNAASDNGAAETVQTTPAATGEVDLVKWNSTYGELASLDPIKAFNYPENTIVANLCEALFQIQPDFSIKPHLAESASTNDGLVWELTLRDDVTFWDGSPMTTEDVVFSINRHLDAEEGSYWAGGVVDNIESVTGEGKVVTITLSSPNFVLDQSLSTIIGTVVQQEHREAAGENYGNPETGVMCTGPLSYEPGNWKQGQSITLQRNDNYWNPNKSAKASAVEIGFVVDPNAISNGLSTGEIQGSYDVPLAALSTLEAQDSGTLYHGAGMQIMAVIATGNGAFGDPAVRRAITLATDRQAITDTVFEGTGAPSRSIAPQAPWDAIDGVEELRDELLPATDYDVAAAKALLEDAEVDLAQPIRIAYPSERSFYADILNEMARGAKELGIELVPTGVPSAQFGAFFSDSEARKGYDGFVTTNYLSSPDPLLHLISIAKTGSEQNYSDLSDTEIDALLDKALAEQDPAERAKITAEAEAQIMEYMPWVPVTDLNARLYMNNEITGAPASFVYLYYPWAAELGAA